MKNPLGSPNTYSLFIHQLPYDYPAVIHSALAYILLGVKIGKVTGMIFFPNNIILCVQEFLNFELQVIEGYGYEVSQARISDEKLPPAKEYCRASYSGKEKYWWYDSFPHPNDPLLASTDQHHKHILPDIKHHRIPAPNLTFTAPNLSFLIEEILSEFAF